MSKIKESLQKEFAYRQRQTAELFGEKYVVNCDMSSFKGFITINQLRLELDRIEQMGADSVHFGMFINTAWRTNCTNQK